MWLSLLIALMRVELHLPPPRLALIVVAIIGLPGAALALHLLAPPYRPDFLPKGRFTLIARTAAAVVIEAGYATERVRASLVGSSDSSF